MSIGVHCIYCGEVDLNEDMGYWCSKCSSEISEGAIISSLLHIVERLQERVEKLEETQDHRII